MRAVAQRGHASKILAASGCRTTRGRAPCVVCTPCARPRRTPSLTHTKMYPEGGVLLRCAAGAATAPPKTRQKEFCFVCRSRARRGARGGDAPARAWRRTGPLGADACLRPRRLGGRGPDLSRRALFPLSFSRRRTHLHSRGGGDMGRRQHGQRGQRGPCARHGTRAGPGVGSGGLFGAARARVAGLEAPPFAFCRARRASR